MISFVNCIHFIYPVEEAILQQPGHLLPVYPVLVSVHHAPLSCLLFLPQMTQYCNTSVALPSQALPCPAVQLCTVVQEQLILKYNCALDRLVYKDTEISWHESTNVHTDTDTDTLSQVYTLLLTQPLRAPVFCTNFYTVYGTKKE